MLYLTVAAVVAVSVVGAVAYGVTTTNWHGVVCTMRRKHKFNWYTDTCKCGHTHVRD